MAIRLESLGEIAPSIQAGEASSIESGQLPRPGEGVFLSQSPDIGVESITYKETADGDDFGNTLTRYRVIMSDGIKLGMNVCEPKDRVTDIPVLETPAWLTGLHGFNEKSQRALGSLGIPSMLIGHVGEERDSFAQEAARLMFKPWEVVREFRAIGLARQARNMLEIQRRASEFMFDPKYIFLAGKSRGAMTLLHALGMAPEFGVTVPFSMPIAACMAKGLSRETLPEERAQLGNEASTVVKLVFRNLVDITETGINTMNPSPKSLAYEAGHTPTLVRGDAGRAIPAVRANLQANSHQHMLMLGYEGDVAGQLHIWKEEFDDLANAHVRGVPGAHSSIADKRTRAYEMRMFDALGQQLADGVKPEELDMSHLERGYLVGL